MDRSNILKSLFNLGHESVSTQQSAELCVEFASLLGRFIDNNEDDDDDDDKEETIGLRKWSVQCTSDSIVYMPAYNCALVSTTAISCEQVEQTKLHIVHT